MQKGFMVLSTNGTGHFHVENQPAKPKAKAPKCGCGGRCGNRGSGTTRARKAEPFDPVRAQEHAARLEAEAVEAERQGRTAWAVELRDRALVVHDLKEAHDREEARKESARIGTAWKPSKILAGAHERSALNR